MSAYKLMLQRGVRRARAMPSSSLIVEGTVRRESPLAGAALRDANLPPETLVVSITRARETIFPTAETVLCAGDIVAAVTPPESRSAVHAMLAG